MIIVNQYHKADFESNYLQGKKNIITKTSKEERRGLLDS